MTSRHQTKKQMKKSGRHIDRTNISPRGRRKGGGVWWLLAFDIGIGVSIDVGGRRSELNRRLRPVRRKEREHEYTIH